MSREIIDFREDTHQYFVNGKEYPSVTAILKSAGLGPDLSMVPPDVLEWKRNFGEQLHKAIELDIIDDLGDYDPILKPYLEEWWKLRDIMKIEPIYPELPVYSRTNGYCGKLDLYAKHSGGVAIFDYKTSSTVEMVSVGAQLSGYEIALREWDDISDSVKIERYVIHFKPNSYLPAIIPMVNRMDKNTFMAALLIHKQKGEMKYV